MDIIKEQIEKLEESGKFDPIKDSHRAEVTESLMRNQIQFLRENADTNTTQTGNVQNWDPILIRMVRRSTPQLMAFDLAGVQPMTGPTGSIFAMRAHYVDDNQGARGVGDEALFNEADTSYSGEGTHSGDTSGFDANEFGSGDPAATTETGRGMSKADGEKLGTTGNPKWREMTFTIERSNVEARTRKLKASFTREIQHDLRQIHGLDAENELANILSTEITAEQDRELLRTINISAMHGAQNTTVAGKFDLDLDSDGRWLVEKFKGLLFQIELEANQVSTDTRRGKANRVICSANVASALNMAGVLEYQPGKIASLQVDPEVSTFAGVLLGRYSVHIDPYAVVDYVTVGYKGDNAWDAGVYWCPYVPLEMVRAVSEYSFQPRIGFATRYGLVANPFAAKEVNGSIKTGQGLGQGENPYFRKMRVANINTGGGGGGTTPGS